MGVIYFKRAQDIYPGDITKNCELSGVEIDGNFYFLRGYDINNIAIDENQNIIIDRVNGEKIILPMGDTINGYEFNYKEGILSIIKPDGEEINLPINDKGGSLGGVYTNNSLVGDGTIDSVLGLANVYKTGVYSRVEEVLTQLPVNPSKGYRAITKGHINKFGRLYTFKEVEEIKKDLASSDWRIPTKEDWDKMLNSIELCDEDRNHDTQGSTKHLGKYAGRLLKSSDMWMPDTEGGNEGEDAYGFTVLPVGKIAQDGKVEGSFYKTSWFWVDSENDDKYTKGFDYDKGTVSQELIDSAIYKCSIRLVRDCDNGSYGDTEVIFNDNTMPCVFMPKSQQVWTSINFALISAGRYEGVTLPEWGENIQYTDEVYTINEWNGKSWDHKQMLEGDSVVIARYNNKEGEPIYDHEWRITRTLAGNVELVDVMQEVDGKIIEEVSARISSDEILSGYIENEKNERIESVNNLTEYVNENFEKIQREDESLTVSLNNEISIRENSDTYFNNEITNIKVSDAIVREDIDTISHRLTTEEQERESEDTRIRNLVGNLNDKLNDEINRATSAEESLGSLKIVSVTPLKEEYASSYELQDKNGNVKGARINITKDKFVKEVKIGVFTWTDEGGNVHTNEYAIKFVFYVGESETQTVFIPTKEMMLGSLGDGLEIVNDKIKVRINNDSEKFLSVSEEGINLQGVQQVIDNKTEGITSELNAKLLEEEKARKEEDEKIEDKFNNLQNEVEQLKSDKIELEERINELSTNLTKLLNGLNKQIKAVLGDTLQGTKTQIKVHKDYSDIDVTEINKITIGFDDDAQFISTIE